MMKRILLRFLLLISATFLFVNIKNHKTEVSNNENLALYVDNELQNNIPKKGEATFIKTVCDNNSKATWDNENWGLFVSNMTKKTKCNLYFSSYAGDIIFNFDYTGSEQIFMVPVSGTYKLETWGAQGGSWKDIEGGYGGYSSGNISLVQGQKIYINVGGTTSDNIGGYNGGGNGCDYIVLSSTDEMANKYLGGGGATHIATASGLLSTLKNSKSNILIASSAGGGGYYYSNYINFKVSGGAGGGITGNSGKIKIDNSSTIDLPATGGTQIAGGLGNNSLQDYSGSFGQGGNGNNQKLGLGTGGGSGYYGGGGTTNIGSSAESGGGGSGYIGNSLLKEKSMYCYNCEESNEEDTKTISTTCSEETPTENCAKKGNGYARITLVSIDE